VKTGEAELLAAVLATPGDNLPRLVYADWLEEHATDERCPACLGDTRHRMTLPGKPERRMLNMVPGTCSECSGTGHVPDGRRERAEFVRVQCELAGFPESPEPGSYTMALRDRERELFQAHGAEWFGRSACITPPNNREEQYGEWRVVHRGFVESVRLTWSDWLEHHKALLAAFPLEKLHLTTRPGIITYHNQIERKLTFKLAEAIQGKPYEVVVEDLRSYQWNNWARKDYAAELVQKHWPALHVTIGPPVRYTGLNLGPITHQSGESP
jgi:uncharacterized protein (TIGR02996 family)